jgi:hypothetical protein
MPNNKEKSQSSVEEKIRSLRQRAESGELGDEVLEAVAGGTVKHIEDPVHIDGTEHIDGPSSQ